MFNYQEQRNDAKSYKEAYVSDIRSFIENRYKQYEQQRNAYITGIAQDPEKYRSDFRNMLGFPLNDEGMLQEKATLSIELLEENNESTLHRATVTTPLGIRFTGLLFLHNGDAPRPFIISQHGGSGSPEVCSGILEGGSANYNDMTQRIFNRGANVFAPQLLLWSNDYESEGFRREDRNPIDAQLKQMGGSITALEVYCIMKALDTFCDEGIADEKHLGMIGLSYGGLYTLFTAAADKRIKAALSCSFFNDRAKYAWIDWTWNDSAAHFFDAEIAMLVYPRPLCIAVGDEDCMFDVTSAQTELDRLHMLSQKIYGNTDWLHTCVFQGNHEFIQSDNYIELVLAEVAK